MLAAASPTLLVYITVQGIELQWCWLVAIHAYRPRRRLSGTANCTFRVHFKQQRGASRIYLDDYHSS